MNEEKIFADGLIFKKPHDNAPDFIKGQLSIKCQDFLEFMKKHSDKGWLNIQLKESQNGKYYAELDTWKPSQNRDVQFNELGERLDDRGEDGFHGF